MSDIEGAIASAQIMLKVLPWKDYTERLTEQEICVRLLAEAALREDVQLSAKEIRSLMEKALSKPKRKRGTVVYPMEARDISIISTIRAINFHFGFDFTVSPASRDKGKESACSIVAMACECSGIKLSEDAILKIWQKRNVYDERMHSFLVE